MTAINDRSDEEQIEFLSKGLMELQLRRLTNPSENVMMWVVQRNGLMIGGVDQPSEALQMAAVAQNHEAIRKIQEPCDAAKRLASEMKTEAKFRASLRRRYDDDLPFARPEPRISLEAPILPDDSVCLYDRNVDTRYMQQYFLLSIHATPSGQIDRVTRVFDPTHEHPHHFTRSTFHIADIDSLMTLQDDIERVRAMQAPAPSQDLSPSR